MKLLKHILSKEVVYTITKRSENIWAISASNKSTLCFSPDCVINEMQAVKRDELKNGRKAVFVTADGSEVPKVC